MNRRTFFSIIDRMHSVVLFYAVYIAVASATLDEECLKLGRPCSMRCCKTAPPSDNHVKECLKLMKDDPLSCEMDICTAKTAGFASSEEGKFDKETAAAKFKIRFDYDPELAQTVIDKCIYGNLTNYGPAELCELGKLRYCTFQHVLTTCPEFKDEEKCKGVKELVDKCAKDI